MPETFGTTVLSSWPHSSALPAVPALGASSSPPAGEYVHCQEAQTTRFTVGLGVEDLDQTRGWGLYLLHRSLWEMRKIGYELTTISTDWRNYRALLLYTNYGYHAIDTVYRWGKNC